MMTMMTMMMTMKMMSMMIITRLVRWLVKLKNVLQDSKPPPEYSIALLIPLLGAALSFLSSDCSPSAVRWRKSLKKSRISPSAAKMAIIWVSLYVAMGHASYLVYIKLPSATPTSMMLSPPLIAYLTQCVLNHFYIIVLFGLQRIDLALLLMFPLWFATGLTALFFYEVSTMAGRLMTLVFSWVSLNIYLNAFLYIYNPVYTEADLPPESAITSRKPKES